MENKKLDFNGKMMLVCGLLNTILSTFTGTFLVAYFKSEDISNYVKIVGTYYLSAYILQIILYTIFSRLLIKANARQWVYRLGVFVKCVFIFIIANFTSVLADKIVLVGMLAGIGDGIYWSSFNVMRTSCVDKNAFGIYYYLESIIGKVINIVLPITLGVVIDMASFSQVGIYIFFIGVFQFICSMLVKPKELKSGKFELMNYLNKVTKNKQKYKGIIYIYKMELLCGLKGNIATFITILNTLIVSKTNTILGYVTAFFSIFQMLSITIYASNKNLKTSKIFNTITTFLPIICAVIMAICLNSVTFLIFNFAYVVVCVILDYSTDEYRSSTVKKYGLESDIAEHQVVCEIILNIGRIISFAYMTVISIFNSTNIIAMIKVVMLVFMLAQVLIARMVYKMRKLY